MAIRRISFPFRLLEIHNKYRKSVTKDLIRQNQTTLRTTLLC